MKLCPDCHTPNLEGTLFCEECGAPFSGVEPPSLPKTKSTEVLNPVAVNENLAPELAQKIEPTTVATKLRTDSQLVLHLSRNGEHIALQQQSEIVIGRADKKTHSYPDLDLTPHGAIDEGVSRTHASLRRNDHTVTLMDLGSANGTFLNGKQIPPNQPHVVRDGDEITFGKLVSRIFFK